MARGKVTDPPGQLRSAAGANARTMTQPIKIANAVRQVVGARQIKVRHVRDKQVVAVELVTIRRTMMTARQDAAEEGPNRDRAKEAADKMRGAEEDQVRIAQIADQVAVEMMIAPSEVAGVRVVDRQPVGIKDQEIERAEIAAQEIEDKAAVVTPIERVVNKAVTREDVPRQPAEEEDRMREIVAVMIAMHGTATHVAGMHADETPKAVILAGSVLSVDVEVRALRDLIAAQTVAAQVGLDDPAATARGLVDQIAAVDHREAVLEMPEAVTQTPDDPAASVRAVLAIAILVAAFAGMAVELAINTTAGQALARLAEADSAAVLVGAALVVDGRRIPQRRKLRRRNPCQKPNQKKPLPESQLLPPRNKLMKLQCF